MERQAKKISSPPIKDGLLNIIYRRLLPHLQLETYFLWGYTSIGRNWYFSYTSIYVYVFNLFISTVRNQVISKCKSH